MKEKDKNNNYLGYMFIGGLIAVTGISGCVLRSNIVSAEGDSVTDTVSITVPVSCTISGNIDTAHTATINNGIYSGATGSEYENGIGKTTLTTFCNDQNGFSIYAIGYTDNEAGNTNLAGTAASGNANIATGTATSGSTSNWAMKVNKVDNPVSGDPVTYNPENMTITSDTEGLFSSYHTVPNTYTKVAEYHALTGSSSTDTGTNALGAKITTTYAAYISPTQPADTYTGQVKYVMVHPYDHAAPIIPPAPSANCNTPVTGATYMQELATMTPSELSDLKGNMIEDSQYYLRDARDEKPYCVALLQDGNIWMTQNLDHDIVATPNYYTNQNTDIGWNSSTNSYDSTTWTAEKATYATEIGIWDGFDFTDSDHPAFIPDSPDNRYHPESYDMGNAYWDGTVANYNSESSCTAAGGTWNSRTTRCNFISSTGNSHYHLGNYYNWSAAVAMNDTSQYTTQNTDLNRSICPAGWMLPKDGNNTTNGSFRYLVEQYSYSSYTMSSPYVWETPLYFPLSGDWYWWGLYDVGSSSGFWSSVVDSSDNAYILHANYNGSVSPDGSQNRNRGQSVRCLTR